MPPPTTTTTSTGPEPGAGPGVTLTSPANGSTLDQAKPTFSGSAATASGDLPTMTVKVYGGSSASGSPVQTLTATATWWELVGAGVLVACRRHVHRAGVAEQHSRGHRRFVGEHVHDRYACAGGDVDLAGEREHDKSGQADVFGGGGDRVGRLLDDHGEGLQRLGCSGSPVQTLTATASGGSWSVRRRARRLRTGPTRRRRRRADTAGTTGDSSANTFTIDTTAPATTITNAPSGRVAIGPVSISFTSNEAGSTFQCSVDGVAYTTCTSPYNIPDPAPGPHSFSVEATNQAGVTEVTPTSAAWSSVQAEQDLCGSLMGSMTIGPDYAARYIITCNLDVPDLVTLAAQPGTIVKADTGTQVFVHGSLDAVGSSGSPITFTSINDDTVGGNTGTGSPAAGDWDGSSPRGAARSTWSMRFSAMHRPR